MASSVKLRNRGHDHTEDELVQARIIIEMFDPYRPKPGGIDTCIRGMIKYAPSDMEIWVFGVDAVGDKTIGKWITCVVEDRSIYFYPAVRLDNANLARRVPHSLRLQAALFMTKFPRKFDVVQTHRVNVGASALVRFHAQTACLLLHSSGTANLSTASKSFFRHAKWLYRATEFIAAKNAKAVIVFSSEGSERLSRRHRNIHFSPTWYDSDKFYPGDRQKQRPPRRKILWACRIEPAKQPRLLVECFASLPSEYQLTVAGDGTLRKDLEARARLFGIDDRVEMLGAVDKSQMGELMRCHDILVMSSEFEGYSRSVVEALATGLPVVTTDGGDPNALIKDGVNGSRYTDASSFSRAVGATDKLNYEDCVQSVADHSAVELVSRIYAKSAGWPT